MGRARWIHGLFLVLAPLPALSLIARAGWGDLGANPIETVTHETGEWALRMLLACLAVTPLRRLFGWHALIRLRRSAGLFAFGYASAHFATWIGLDHFFEWAAILEDIVERPWVTVGSLAWVGLLALALTSTRASIRRLGRRWSILHRLVYVSGALAILHYLWLVKADLTPPLIHGGILALLLGLRWIPRHPARPPPRQGAREAQSSPE